MLIAQKELLTFGFSNIGMKLDRVGYDDDTEEGIRDILIKELHITRSFNCKSEQGR
ncbi:MAG: hypothetical protein ACJAQ2_001852 [Vicingaceae bacterium]